MARHDSRIDERIRGSSWDSVRERFLAVHGMLLGVDENASSELTTIYVKYKITQDPLAAVYGVVWLKSSKQLWLGLALPDIPPHHCLVSAPAGMRYKNLNAYCRLDEMDRLPPEFTNWIKNAF